jgi:hypothetical protein
MRKRRRPYATVLAMTIVSMLVMPLAAAAASGLPPTISMDPEAGGPGETVWVSGLNFPGDVAVELLLVTSTDSTFLGAATSEAGGYFTQRVTLPPDATAGDWQLVANTADGTSASYGFTSGATVVDANVAAASAGSSGNSMSDIMVMLVVAFVIAGVLGGIGYVWFQLRVAPNQTGMAVGDDPIWSGSKSADPAKTATDEPAWLTSQPDPEASES